MAILSSNFFGAIFFIKVVTNKWLTLKFGEATKAFKMLSISDAKPDENDVRMCLNHMKNKRGGARYVLSKKEAIKMRKVQDNLINNYTYTVEDIQKSVEEKKNLSKKISNIAAEKTKSDIAVKAATAQLEEVKGLIKELESRLLEVEDAEEEKVQDELDIAKSRVEELQEDLKKKKLIQKKVLEAEAQRLERFAGNKKMQNWAKVNQKAKAANKAADVEAYKAEVKEAKKGAKESIYGRRKAKKVILWEVGQKDESVEESKEKDAAVVSTDEALQDDTNDTNNGVKESQKRNNAKTTNIADQMADIAIAEETITAGMNGASKKVTSRVRKGISIQEYLRRKEAGTL